jgi:hypothetical protein
MHNEIKDILYSFSIPLELIYYILIYDRRFIIRNRKIININRFNEDDNRYKILNEKRPLINIFWNAPGCFYSSFNKKVHINFKFGWDIFDDNDNELMDIDYMYNRIFEEIIKIKQKNNNNLTDWSLIEKKLYK